MKYYIMFQDDNKNHEMIIIVYEKSEYVVAFIEDKINNHAYILEDFMVIQGTLLSLRAERAQVKVLLIN